MDEQHPGAWTDDDVREYLSRTAPLEQWWYFDDKSAYGIRVASGATMVWLEESEQRVVRIIDFLERTNARIECHAEVNIIVQGQN